MLKRQVAAVVLDVDGTLTMRDTTEELITAAIESAAKSGNRGATPGSEGEAFYSFEEMKRRKLQQWEELKTTYANHHGLFLAQLLATEQAPPVAVGPSSSPIEASLLQHFLEEERAEYESVRRVAAARMLEGLSREDCQELGRRLASSNLLRPGAAECLRRLAAAACGVGGGGVEVHALSANWSKDFLVGVLDGLIDQDKINTNELLYHEQEPRLSTGEMCMRVVSALDKHRFVKRLKEEVRAKKHPNNSGLLYVGDGLNDLLAMLEADYGVLIGSNEHMVNALMRHNIDLRPLQLACYPRPSDTQKRLVLWQANNWDELVGWLF